MNEQMLINTASQMVAKGKGILAADESTPTAGKRLLSIGVESTYETRNEYRDMLFTSTDMENFIIILNIIIAILLVAVILLQKSEGGALGLGVSQESFISSRSAGSVLTKATAVIATLFIVTSISLTIMSKEQFSSSSVLEKVEEKQDPSEPEIPKSD